MNMEGNKWAILSFSGRKDGNCDKIAAYLHTLYDGKIFSFAQLNVHPCGQCRYECFECGANCPHIGDDLHGLYETVLQSDCACYVLPNYCDYPNANFFAFNERSLCVFSGNEALLDAYSKVPKKFIVISGGEEDHFRAVLSQHAENPDILFLRAKDYGQSSINGSLTESPECLSKIEAFLKKERPVT